MSKHYSHYQSRTLFFCVALLVSLLFKGGMKAWTQQRLSHQKQLNQRLLSAILQNDTPAVLSLLDQGADPNAEGVAPKSSEQTTAQTTELPALLLAGEDQYSPATGGTHPASEEIRLALVKHGAEVNVQTENGITPLIIAVQQRDEHLVHVLLDKGAEVNAGAQKGQNILFYTSPESPCFDLLLERGADADRANSDGYTALIRAINEDNLSAVNHLIAKGVDVNRVWLVLDRETPLMLAAEDGKVDIVNALLKAGADVQAKDKKGRTALQLAEAEWAERRKTGTTLTGGRMHIESGENSYALSRTYSDKHQEVIRLLRQAGATEK